MYCEVNATLQILQTVLINEKSKRIFKISFKISDLLQNFSNF